MVTRNKSIWFQKGRAVVSDLMYLDPEYPVQPFDEIKLSTFDTPFFFSGLNDASWCHMMYFFERHILGDSRHLNHYRLHIFFSTMSADSRGTLSNSKQTSGSFLQLDDCTNESNAGSNLSNSDFTRKTKRQR